MRNNTQENKPRVRTHINIDTDAAWSTAAFLSVQDSPESWQIDFVPSDYDGKSLQKGDFVFDVTVPPENIPEGCTVIKGEKRDKLTMSAFASVIKRFFPEDIAKGLSSLVSMIDLEDAKGKAIRRLTWKETDIDNTEMLHFTSLFAIINYLRHVHVYIENTGVRGDEAVIRVLTDIMKGYYLLAKKNEVTVDRDISRLEMMARLWAIRKFVPGQKDAHTWDIPKSLGDFPNIVQTYDRLSTDEVQALSVLSSYISLRQSHGDIWRHICPGFGQDKVDMFKAVSLETILEALSLYVGTDTLEKRQKVFRGMCLIFDGIYGVRMTHIKKIRRYEADPDKYFTVPNPQAPVAIKLRRDKYLSYYLYSHLGFKILVFDDENDNGYCTGISCDNGPWGLTEFGMDNPHIVSVFTELGEDPYVDKRGFVTAMGTGKSPSSVRSQVDISTLAKRGVDLCQEHSVSFG